MTMRKTWVAATVLVGSLSATVAIAAEWRYVGTPPTGITIAQIGPDRSPSSPTVRHCPSGSTATIDGNRLLCRVLGPDVVDFNSWDDQTKEYAPLSCSFHHDFPGVSWSFKKSFSYQVCGNLGCSPKATTPDIDFSFSAGAFSVDTANGRDGNKCYYCPPGTDWDSDNKSCKKNIGASWNGMGFSADFWGPALELGPICLPPDLLVSNASGPPAGYVPGTWKKNGNGNCEATYRVFRKNKPTIAKAAFECLTPEAAIPVGSDAMTCWLGSNVIATPKRERLSSSWCPPVAPHMVVVRGHDLCVAQSPTVLLPKITKAPKCTTVSTTKGTENNSSTDTITTCDAGVTLTAASLSGAIPAICPLVNPVNLYNKTTPLEYVIDGSGTRDACDGYVNALVPGYYLPFPAPAAALKDNGMRLLGAKRVGATAAVKAPNR